ETFQKLIALCPDFKDRIALRIDQYDYKKNAVVPVDFAEEMLPASATGEEIVRPRRVDIRIDPARSLPASNGYNGNDRKHLHAFRHVSEIDVDDSGAACLAMVCQHFDRAASLARIRQIVYSGPTGPSLKNLCRGAEELGLAARGVQVPVKQLSEMP